MTDEVVWEGDTLLSEAKSVIEARGKEYEEPRAHFRKVSTLWTVLLEGKLKPGEKLTPLDVLLLMDALKSARLAHNQTHTDSAVDKAGYVELMGRFL